LACLLLPGCKSGVCIGDNDMGVYNDGWVYCARARGQRKEFACASVWWGEGGERKSGESLGAFSADTDVGRRRLRG
jgi:hypothetical protein